MTTRVLKADGGRSASAAREGAKALQAGELVGFATETVYGVGAMAADPSAMERLRELKSRPKRPFSVHLGRPADAARYVANPGSRARRLMASAWPGPVTLLLPTGGALADGGLQEAGLHEVLAAGGVIALRCPDEPVAQAMLSSVPGPVVASSANLTGQPSARTAEEVLKVLDGRFEVLIDSGPTRYGKDSTIVRFADDGPEIVRRGVYDERMIRRLIRRRLLFVCTGNTCRSPMAAGLAKQELAERLGCTVGGLRREGVEVLSAGLYAGTGARPTPEAVAAADRLGAAIARHRSRPVTAELIGSADVVFCMTDLHVAEVRRMAPSAGGRVRRLSPRRDIRDPIGGGQEAYRRTAEEILASLRDGLSEIGL